MSSLAQIPRIARINRYRGCLVGAAIGNALGMPFVGKTCSEEITSFHPHPDGKLKAGQVTNDILLSQATVHSLLKVKGLNPANIASNLGLAFTRNPGRGFGSTTITALTRLGRGKAWNTCGATGLYAAGSGPASRIAPIALFSYANLDQLRRNVEIVSMITHNNQEAINGSLVVAYIIARIINTTFDQKSILQETTEFIGASSKMAQKLHRVEELLTQPELQLETALSQIGTSGSVFDAVGSSVYIFLRHVGSFETAVVKAASCGGDAATIAGIVGALSGTYHGDEAIKTAWKTSVEHGKKILTDADRLYNLSHGTIS